MKTLRPMTFIVILFLIAVVFYGCNRAAAAELTPTNSTVHLKLLPKLNRLLVVPFTQIALYYTNFYNAHELELVAGASDSLNNYQKNTGYGMEIGGTYWNTRYTGTGIRAGMNLTQPTSNLFGWSQVDYSIRWPLWRFAPGARVGLGKSFVDGETFTKVEITGEFRFSPTFGIEAAVGEKFCSSPEAGLGASVVFTWSF